MVRFALALVVALLGCTPALAGDWLQYAEPEFEVYGNAPPRKMLEAVRSMQVYRYARQAVLPQLQGSASQKLRVFVLDGDTFARFARPREGVVGFVQPRDFGADIVIDASASDWSGTESTVQHELTHYYLRQSSQIALPVWYDEGLSEYLSTIDIWRGKLRVGVPASGRWADLQSLPWMPLREVFAVRRSSEAYRNHRGALSFYAQSWLVTHYMIAVGGDDARALEKMLAGVDIGQPVDFAIREAFGAGFPAFEVRVRDYGRAKAVQYVYLPAPTLPELRGRITPLDESRGLTELAMLGIRLRRFGDSPLQGLVDRLADDPANLAAQAAQAFLARRKGDWNAATPALRACAAPAADAETLVLCGNAWMAPAWEAVEDSPPRDEPAITASRVATGLYERAWRQDPGNFPAMAARVMAYSHHMEGGEALRADLEAAVGRYPRSIVLRAQLAEVQADSGDLEGARRTLEDVMKDSRDPDERLSLIRRLRQIESEIAERDASATPSAKS